MSNIFIRLKKTCLGVLERRERDQDNEIGLKEEGGIEMSTTVLHSRTAPSLKYLPYTIGVLLIRHDEQRSYSWIQQRTKR